MKTLVAYLWWCGDDYCDCTQAVIARHHPHCKHLSFDGRESHRAGETIWEGRFETDGSPEPYEELERTLEAMQHYWPEVWEKTIDLS